MSEVIQPTDYQPVPADAARQIAEAFGKSVVVIISFDTRHDLMHMTTYGVSALDKEWAAETGELIASFLGCDAREYFEDYRHLDAGEAAARIEQLVKACVSADHAIASVMAVREGIADASLQATRDLISAAIKRTSKPGIHGVTPASERKGTR